jgi:hypothetical protein
MAKTTNIPTTLSKVDAGFSAKTEVIGKRQVRATFSIRRSADEAAYVKEAVFDFSNVSDEELLVMSMYQAKVRLQALLRAMPTEQMLNPSTLAQIDVKKDLVERAPRQTDPDSAAIRNLMKLGVDEHTARGMVQEAKAKAASKGKKAA